MPLSAGVRQGGKLGVPVASGLATFAISRIPAGAEVPRRKASINAVLQHCRLFIENSGLQSMLRYFCSECRFLTVQFESANPTVVKSIKQRDLLNTWLRLYAREQRLSGIDEYQPARLEDELADLV